MNIMSGNETIAADFIGQKAIVRTYSAGVWFGTLHSRQGSEVVLTAARRLWRWHTNEGISLSGVANAGVNHDKSRIERAVEKVWLHNAIEIIPCAEQSIASIEGAPDANPK
jgi:hypothetical protein